MAQALISEKYLIDIANAIRVKLGSAANYTPAQMAAAIATIDGTISGSITPSTATGKGIITNSNLTAIANAIRAKLDVETLYTPAQMAAAILSIEAAGPAIVSWSSGSDADVAAMIDAAHAGTIDLQQDGGWAVGDVRSISVGSFVNARGDNVSQGTRRIVLTSFDEYMSCGNVLQFDFLDEISFEGMNVDRTNAGGYNSSAVKNTTLPNAYNAMPNWIKTRLLSFSVLTTEGGGSSNVITVENNKLALRSRDELFGSSYNTGNQLPYFQTAANRIKKYNNADSYSWSRDAINYSSFYTKNYWVQITSSGDQGTEYADNLRAIAPFGCL